MGRKAQKKAGAQRPKMTYKVVQQSYEDPDFEDEPKPVLVPTAQLDKQFSRKPKRSGPMVEFHDDMPEDYTNRRNMTMLDDEAPDGIFDDEVEEDFDQDWIKQMMEGPADEEEEEWDSEDENDPTTQKRKESKHQAEEFGSDERQFARMMKGFDNDEDIEEEDPRTQGPLPIEAYSEALVSFAEDHAGTSWMDIGDAQKHKGFINQLKKMSRENNIFDQNGNGLFYALLPDKGARMQKNFREEHRELVELTKAQLARGEIDTEDILDKTDQEILKDDGDQIITLKMPKHDRMDCETVLSNYSTLYNRPNIVAAEKGKLKIPQGIKRNRGHMSQDDLTAVNGPTKMTVAAANKKTAEENEDAAPVGVINAAGIISLKKKKAVIVEEPEEEEEEEGGEQLPDFEQVRYELSMPKKGETKEEKAARKKLVKQLQAERRVDKKGLKGAYGVVGKQEVVSRKSSRTDKAIQPMSMIAGVVAK